MEDSFSGAQTLNPEAGEASHAIERTLLKIWSEVLNTEITDIHQDFLSMGGDSMAAMRCISRIHAAYGVELPISLFLLESPSISLVVSEIAKIQFDPTAISTA